MPTFTGGCHCGRVRFAVSADLPLAVADCNCSICTRTGFLHLIVPAQRFELLQGAESLTSYSFNTGVARHLFCQVCGIKAFYVPRSHPDGYSVNVRCLDLPQQPMVVTPFEGRDWERGRAEFRDAVPLLPPR